METSVESAVDKEESLFSNDDLAFSNAVETDRTSTIRVETSADTAVDKDESTFTSDCLASDNDVVTD